MSGTSNPKIILFAMIIPMDAWFQWMPVKNRDIFEICIYPYSLAYTLSAAIANQVKIL